MGSLSIFNWLVLIFIGVLVFLIYAFLTRSRMRRKLFSYAERRAYGETPLEEPTPDSGRQTTRKADP
jgi:Ni,Fe-hydrogenase I cytochrome b subunit